MARMVRFAVVVALLLSAEALAQDTKEVTVTGMGMSKDEAVNDALRKAVEEAAGTFIYSQSESKDFALIRDTVLVRSAGFVQSRQVLSAKENPVEGTWEVRVKAVVSVQGIQDTWGVVKDLLDRMGRPKIMGAITETIDGNTQDDSTVQTRIEGLLLESGFKLVNKDQLSAIEKKDVAAAVLADKPEVIQAIAQKFGAQLFITGSTSASPGQAGQAYGVRLFRYGADGDIKCYRSDTAELMSSRNGRTFTNDRAARLAAKKALAGLGDDLGPTVQRDILTFWRDALGGLNSAKLVIEGIDFDQLMELEEALEALEQITAVDSEYNDPLAEIELETDMPAKKLARVIAKEIKSLKVTNVSQNVIRAELR